MTTRVNGNRTKAFLILSPYLLFELNVIELEMLNFATITGSVSSFITTAEKHKHKNYMNCELLHLCKSGTISIKES